jgi:chemotaxis response regulator CheB
MGFHPPARQVLSVLPLNTDLELIHEATNEYDPNAVRVVVDMGKYPVSKMEALHEVLRDTGFNASEICAKGVLHLGYVAASGKPTARGGPGNVEVLMLASAKGGLQSLQSKLSAFPDGSPAVVIEAEVSG